MGPAWRSCRFPTPLFDVDGSLIGAVNMLMDVSDRKREEGDSKRLTQCLEEEVEQRTEALAETIAKLKESERTFRLLVEGVTDYAIYMLDTSGRVANWNAGASRIKGYARAEIVGQHFSKFYTEEARAAGLPELALSTAGNAVASKRKTGVSARTAAASGPMWCSMPSTMRTGRWLGSPRSRAI